MGYLKVCIMSDDDDNNDEDKMILIEVQPQRIQRSYKEYPQIRNLANRFLVANNATQEIVRSVTESVRHAFGTCQSVCLDLFRSISGRSHESKSCQL